MHALAQHGTHEGCLLSKLHLDGTEGAAPCTSLSTSSRSSPASSCVRNHCKNKALIADGACNNLQAYPTKMQMGPNVITSHFLRAPSYFFLVFPLCDACFAAAICCRCAFVSLQRHAQKLMLVPSG